MVAPPSSRWSFAEPKPGKVRLIGGRIVSDFRPITADEAQPLVSPEAKKHVLVAYLKEQGFPPLGTLPEKHRDHGPEEVVFGDRPMQSARWPHAGFVEFNKVIESGASGVTHWVSRTVYRPGSFLFPGERAKLWDFPRGIYLHGFWCYEWSDEVLKAACYDPTTGELRLAAKHAYGVGSPCKQGFQALVLRPARLRGARSARRVLPRSTKPVALLLAARRPHVDARSVDPLPAATHPRRRFVLSHLPRSDHRERLRRGARDEPMPTLSRRELPGA